MGTDLPVDRGPAAVRRRRRMPCGRAALAAAAAAVALGAGVTPASAADPTWGYEQISPATSASLPVLGMGASKDMSMVVATTRQYPLLGYPADGRGGNYGYGLPRGRAPWSLGPVDATNYSQAVNYVRGIAADGSRVLWGSQMASVDGRAFGFYRVDAQGGADNAGPGEGSAVYASSDDLRTQAFRSDVDPGNPVKVSTAGHAPVVASVDNAGAPMTTTALGGSPDGSGHGDPALTSGSLAADGSSVIFTSTDGIPGDDDGGGADVYRRILTPGAEQTIEISDATPGAGADAAGSAHYRWATADHQRVFFISEDALAPDDTDGEPDVYMRAGTSTPVRISQGETVDGAPTGNASIPDSGQRGERPEWVLSSQDGNRTFFVTSERLTQDAPADGSKLYERDVAEGRTRLVAGPLNAGDLSGDTTQARGALFNTFYQDITFRGLRVTPDGAVFLSKAPLGGAPADEQLRVFVWTRGGGVVALPAATTFLPTNLTNIAERAPMEAGRGVSADGSRVFFTTGQSLTADDTDGGHVDVYVWTAAGGTRLVTPPGRAPYDAAYIDSSPDGSEVYFNTNESILPGDTDPNATDVYLAILGGGTAPGKPAPDTDEQICTGDACQGTIAGPPALPSIGSVDFAGHGNVLAGPIPVEPSVVVSKLKTVTGFAAKAKVRVPGAGRISVAGSSLRARSVTASKAGTYAVTVALSARGKASLKRRRTVKVQARIAYRATDGGSATTTVTVTFQQPKAKQATTKKGGR